MIQKYFCRTLLLCGLLSSAALSQIQRDYNFNSNWKLHVGEIDGGQAAGVQDADWKSVTLPHAFNEDEAFHVDIAKLSTGIAWYRKIFRLPDGAAGMKVFLEFQGVRQAAEVWVNGKSVVRSENGVMAFGADITAAITPGDNLVAVRCDNSYSYREKASNSPIQWNDKNFYANYGGINKNVVLHLTDKLHQTLPLFSSLGTTGIYVHADNIEVAAKTATVVAEAQVKNEYLQSKQVICQVSLIDQDDKEVAHFSSPPVEIKAGETVTLAASQKVTGLNFWSWGYGYLYTVNTSLEVDGKIIDRVSTRTGFRKTDFSNGCLTLNDRTIQLKGYAQRTTNEWPALGIDIPPWVSDFSNGLMVQGNANLVRWMHVTPSKQDVESCDRVGLIQSMPAGDSEGDPTGRRWDFRVELMRDAIIYNRNNPSIIFYEAGNKGIRDEHMDEMLNVKRQYDPDGGRAMGSREMLGSKTAEWGGEMLYINKSASKPMWATEYMRDESLRMWADEKTPPFHKNGDGPAYKNEQSTAYNRNADDMAVETVNRWYDYWHERPGTGRRVNAGGVNIIFSDSNTHHRGTENYRTSGEVDAMRLPKEGYFVNQVMWNGWVDVENPGIHIVGHWNYPAGTKKNVQVVSSADKVEVILNGKSLGFGKQSSRFLFTFEDVAYQHGALSAVGYDSGGKKLCDAAIHTVGEPAAIRLTPHTDPNGFQADGCDVALVDVEIVDANGDRCPTAFNLIHFAIDGPAEWRGGIAHGADNYILNKSLPVELGVNRVAIRSTTVPGAIRITADTEKLRAATLILNTVAIKGAGGLNVALPGEALKSSMVRGPTPLGHSEHPTRIPLDIVSSTAGSASDQAAQSIDDNETTAWTSTGPATDAWIKYELAKPSKLSEVTMKLSGWRTRSYPIEILVDRQLVFKGTTPQSLGYVTIPVKPSFGKTVTIRLNGATSDDDKFDLTEITGKKQAAGTTAPGGGKATLSLVEVELYAPIEPAPQ